MPVKLDMISSSKSETPKGTTAKSSSSTMSGSEMPRTATSAVTVTVTQYGSRSLPDSEYVEDDGKTEMTASSETTKTTTTAPSSDGNSDPRTASKEKEPEVGSVDSRRGEQSDLPPTPTSEESESNSAVVSTEKSPVETTSDSLESSMTSSVQVTYSFGQLGTASLFNDIVPDPSDKPHITSLTMTINPSDVKTFAPISSSSTDAGHFLGLRAPQVDDRSTVGPAQSQDGSENEQESEAMAKGPFRDEPRGGGAAAASNLEFGPRASAELPTFTKKSSRADALPDMSDILTGLFNVVGEGLSIATNYVKEQSKNKDTDVDDEDAGDRGDVGAGDKVDRLPPASLTSRVNNRGPPRFTEIPFEAIPLEVLQSQLPGGGGGKVQIQQRPFHTKRIKVTKTRVRPPPTQPTRLPPRPPTPPRPQPPRQQPPQRPPYAAGIPLPELLIPEDIVLPPPQDGDENGIHKNGNVNNAFGFNYLQQGDLEDEEAGLRPRHPRPPPLRKRPQVPERQPVLFPAEIPGNGEIPGEKKPYPGKGQVNGDVNKNNNNDNDDFDLLVHTYFPDVESRPPPGIIILRVFV